MSRIGLSICGFFNESEAAPSVVDKTGAWFPVNTVTPDPSPVGSVTTDFPTQYPIRQADWQKAVEWKWRVRTWNIAISGGISWKAFILFISDYGNVLARQITINISQNVSVLAANEQGLISFANSAIQSGAVDVSSQVSWAAYEVNGTPSSPPPPFTAPITDDPSAGGAITATLHYSFATGSQLLDGEDLLIPMELSLVIDIDDPFLAQPVRIVFVTADNGAGGAYTTGFDYTGATVNQGVGIIDNSSFQFRGFFVGTQADPKKVLDTQALMSDAMSNNPTFSTEALQPSLWTGNPIFGTGISIVPVEWWGYDNGTDGPVWNTANGAQLIDPIPGGL